MVPRKAMNMKMPLMVDMRKGHSVSAFAFNILLVPFRDRGSNRTWLCKKSLWYFCNSALPYPVHAIELRSLTFVGINGEAYKAAIRTFMHEYDHNSKC